MSPLSAALRFMLSPSRLLSASPAGKQLFDATWDAARKKYVYYGKHLRDFDKAIPFSEGTKKSAAVALLLDNPVLPEDVAKLPTELRSAYEFGKAKLAAHAAEANLAPNRRIRDYLPHMFNRDQLESEVRLAMKSATDPKDQKRLQSTLNRLTRGAVQFYEDLPKEIRFNFFENRKGAPGFELDFVKAYRSYLYGLGRKLYDEPVLEQSKALIPQIEEPWLRDYANKYVRDYMGLLDYDRGRGMDISRWIRNVQFMSKLGFSPRAAIVNMTQQIANVSELGPGAFATGVKLFHSPEGRKLLEDSGHTAGLDQIFQIGVSSRFPTARRILSAGGFLFSKAEEANRGVAYLGGIAKAMQAGTDDVIRAAQRNAIPADVIQQANDVVRRTQGVYGKVDLPMIARGPLASVALQFSITPLKIIEGQVENFQRNPLQLLPYLGISYGVMEAAEDLFDIDLSDVLGAGKLHHALVGLYDLTKDDFREAQEEFRRARAGGFGLLPVPLLQGRFGPGIEAGQRTLEALKEGIRAATGEVAPSTARRRLSTLARQTLEPVAPGFLRKALTDYQAGGSANDFVQQLIGFPGGETVVRRAVVSAMERGRLTEANKVRQLWRQRTGRDLTIDPTVLQQARTEAAQRRRELRGFRQPQIPPSVLRRLP